MEPGDQIISVNGRDYLEALREGTEWLRAGVPNAYALEKRDGTRILADLAPEPASWVVTPLLTLLHGLLALVAAIYLITGGLAWWLKPDRPEARALLLFCCTMAVQLATTLQTDFITWGWPRLVVNAPLIGATTFHLFTTYPIEPDWVVRHRRVQWIPYWIAIGLIVLGFVDTALGLPAGTGVTCAFGFSMLLFSLSLGIVALERHRHREGPLRDRADLMFAAAAVSFVPILCIFAAEWMLRTPFPFYVALLWAFIFPVAVSYGIIRGQLFEIRNVAKSSAAHTAATLAITGVFALLITFADAAVSRLNISFRWFQVSFLFLAILAFTPLRNRLQSLVNRFFDRDLETYRVAVREISEAMVSMLSLNEIADRILVALTDTMGVERAMVLLADDNGKVLRDIASRGDWDRPGLATEIPSDHPIWKHLWMRREDLARVDFDEEQDVESREACRDVFDTLEVELLVPILYGVDLLGVIAVGRKISGDRLAGDDRLLLRTLNNPIGFVHANLQLLDEYVEKLVDGQRTESDTKRIQEAINKLLERSREGTQRVKKIVQDLRTFSRMDQAELQEADLHEEIDRTLRLMEPRFKNNIEVERHYGDIPRVRCYAGQLNQVFLNLLMNSCDAIEQDGTIRITTRPTGDGVRLEFHDDGPGIPEDEQSRIFDPFFTTKPVGVGTGLGLSLSHGIIERHGGRISVASQPGRGTTFVIELPLDATPAG